MRLELEVAGETHEGVTAIAQNSDPFTYFANVPIRICEDIGFDDGTLSMALLHRAKQRDMLPIAARVLSQRLHASRHRQIDEFDDVAEATVRSISRDEDDQLRPFPVQVDGDYIGEYTELRLLGRRPARSPSSPSCLGYLHVEPGSASRAAEDGRLWPRSDGEAALLVLAP